MKRYWISLSHSSSRTHCRYFKHPALHLRGVGTSSPSLPSGLMPQPYFNRIMRDHTWHALSKCSSSITRLNCFPGRLALRIFLQKKTCGPWLLNNRPRSHPQLPHQINFGNVWKLLGLLYPKNTSKVSLNQCRGVWQW
ncbi:hypothetical protein TNCV_1107631 [Trichonephila clavipes]|nr:hypothetical protein TNCV_1107631 [Trichonephila clavipes]